MANSRIDYFGKTLIDLTSDSVTASDLVQGTTAHDKAGNSITGTLIKHSVYIGSTEPTASVGANGDLYILIEE